MTRRRKGGLWARRTQARAPLKRNHRRDLRRRGTKTTKRQRKASTSVSLGAVRGIRAGVGLFGWFGFGWFGFCPLFGSYPKEFTARKQKRLREQC